MILNFYSGLWQFVVAGVLIGVLWYPMNNMLSTLAIELYIFMTVSWILFIISGIFVLPQLMMSSNDNSP